MTNVQKEVVNKYAIFFYFDSFYGEHISYTESSSPYLSFNIGCEIDLNGLPNTDFEKDKYEQYGMIKMIRHLISESSHCLKICLEVKKKTENIDFENQSSIQAVINFDILQ
jgi:hypothetical protein